ncbi:Agamous-like MADS-box protein agl80 [Dionaea muscipula]
MTRKKVKLAYITNDSARKATYKKRKKGFLKKMYELTTLCEIKACAIIYSPYDAQPEVWPSTADAQQVLSKFRRMPEMEKSKKMVNQEEFLRQRINKAAEQLRKLQKDNREKEMTQLMYQCLSTGGKSLLHNLDVLDLNDLGWLIDQNLKAIYKRLENLNKETAAKQLLATGAQQERVYQDIAMGGGFEIMGTMEQVGPQPWYMEMMNPHDQMAAGGFGSNVAAASITGAGAGAGAGENKMLMTFADYSNNVNPLWSSAFFP